MADAAFLPPVYEPEPPAAPAVDELIYNDAHVDEAVGHLIEFFRKPRTSALTAAIARQSQQVEDLLWQIKGAFDLDTAVGEQLDWLGRRVGERRQGRADDDYRAAVRARRFVLRSRGRVSDFYKVALALLPSATVRVQDFYPFAVVVSLTAVLGAVTPATIAAMLRRTKRAGVRLDLLIVDLGSSFVWTTAPAGSSALGWSSTATPNAGGLWVQVA